MVPEDGGEGDGSEPWAVGFAGGYWCLLGIRVWCPSCVGKAPPVPWEVFSCTWIPPVKCPSTLWSASNYYSTKTKHQKLIALERSLTIFV